MALQDFLLTLSEAQDDITTVGDHYSKSIDLGEGVDPFGNARAANYGDGIGEANTLQIKVVGDDFASGGSGTLAVTLQDSADDSSWADTEMAVDPIAVADLVKGYTILKRQLPETLRRYIRLKYTVGTAALSDGKVDAYIGYRDSDV
jgi:hypothetical protein